MATRRIFTRYLARATSTMSLPQRPLALVSLSCSAGASSVISTSQALSLFKPNLSIAMRSLSTTPARRHGHVQPPKAGEELWVTFIDKDGQEHKIAVSKGDNLLDIAQEHDLEMEGIDTLPHFHAWKN